MAGMLARHRLVEFLLVSVVMLGACDPGSTSAPSSTVKASVSPAASGPAVPSTTSSGGVGAVGQTDTEWGRIWDAVPDGFPRYAGSTAGDEGATGPASAIVLVQTADAKGIATFFQTALQDAGYTTDGLSGPLEDGGYFLDMTGPTAGCKLQVTAAPTGGLTTVTILYGAACPFG
jgi:hypothetical protein